MPRSQVCGFEALGVNGSLCSRYSPSSRVADTCFAGTAAGFLVASAHVRTGSLLTEFEVVWSAIELRCQPVAESLCKAFVLIIIWLYLALAVTLLTLLGVSVHFEVQSASSDMVAGITLDF